MPLPALANGSRKRSSAGVWALSVVAVLALSGCAGTQPSSDSASLESDRAYGSTQSRLFSYADNDEIGRLVARLERPRARVRTPAHDFDSPPQAQSDFVAAALAHLGTPYKYGGSSPEAGFDCSGLVWFTARKSLGLHLPRNAAAQAREGTKVERTELQRGDLVFFNTLGRRYSHVGIYVGNGRFVHSPRSGSRVRVDDMSSRYWNTRYNGARRLPVDDTTRLAAASRP